jgi:hypothetical protein
MKNRFLLGFFLLLLGIPVYSQKKTTIIPKLHKDNASVYCESNYKEKTIPFIGKFDIEPVNCSLDTEKLYRAIKKEISAENLDILNQRSWTLLTKVTSVGKISSVAFLFSDYNQSDADELSRLSDRIKDEVEWKLRFNKETKDTFYLWLGLNIPAQFASKE